MLSSMSTKTVEASTAKLAKTENAVFKVHVTSLPTDYRFPWRTPDISESTGSGFILNFNHQRMLITNAHVVAHARHIQVNLAADTKQFKAETVVVDHQTDLALLKVDDAKFWAQASTFELGENAPKRGERIVALGFPTGGNSLCVTEGVVSRLEINGYAHSKNNVKLLSGHIDAPIAPGNSGGPALSTEGKVVGIVHQTGQLGEMIPLPMLERFLKEHKEISFKPHGIPSLGLLHQNLENRHLRRHYGLTDEQHGILIINIPPLSSAQGILKKYDILLEIDGYPISDDGMIRHPDGSTPLHYQHAVNKYVLSNLNNIQCKILRHGQELTVKIPLINRVGEDDLVPLEQDQSDPDFYYTSGVIIGKLTKNYLHQNLIQNGTCRTIPPHLTRFFARAYQAPLNVQKTTQQNVFFVQEILNSDVTENYSDLKYEAIRSINGVKTENIASVLSALNRPLKAHVIELEDGEQMILPHLSIKEDTELKERYQIIKTQPSRYRLFNEIQPLFFQLAKKTTEKKAEEQAETTANKIMTVILDYS